jgi:hypothetical protein
MKRHAPLLASFLAIATTALLSCDSSSSTPEPAAPPQPVTVQSGDTARFVSGPADASRLSVVTPAGSWRLTFWGPDTFRVVEIDPVEGDTLATTKGRSPVVMHLSVTRLDTLSMLVRSNTTSDVRTLLQAESGGVLLDAWEPDDSLSRGPTLSADSSRQRTLHPRDVDFLRVRTEADRAYRVRLEGKSAGRIAVLDASGDLWIEKAFADTATLTFTVRDTGTWAVRVRSQGSADTGAYTVTILSTPLLPQDKWECKGCWSEDGDTLKWDVENVLRTLVPQDRDHSFFVAESGKAVELRGLSERPVSFEIYDPQGYQVGIGRTNDSASQGGAVFVARRSGVHKVYTEAITPADSTSYRYVLKTAGKILPDQAEPDDSATSAKRIPIDSSLQKRTLEGTRVDWFKAELDSGEVYVLHAEGTQRLDVDVYKLPYRPGDATEWSTYLSSGDSLVLPVTATATYGIRIQPYSQIDVTYGLRLSIRPPMKADAGEPDDVQAKAFLIAADSQAVARNMEIEGSDWFRIPVKAGRVYTFAVEGEQTEVEMAVVDRSGDVLAEVSWASLTPTVSWFAAKDDTVWVHLQPGDVGPYVFRASSAKDEVPADSLETEDSLSPPLIALPDTIRRTLKADDVDWLRFEAKAGQSFLIWADFDTYEFRELEVRGPDGESIDWTSSFDPQVSGTIPTDGTYRIRLSGDPAGRGEYELGGILDTSSTKESFEPDDNLLVPKDTMTVDGTPHPRHLGIGDRDRVLFLAEAGKTYKLTAQGTPMDVALLSTSGSTLQSWSHTVSTPLSKTWTAPSTGAFVLAFDGYWSYDFGDVSFTIAAQP